METSNFFVFEKNGQEIAVDVSAYYLRDPAQKTLAGERKEPPIWPVEDWLMYRHGKVASRPKFLYKTNSPGKLEVTRWDGEDHYVGGP